MKWSFSYNFFEKLSIYNRERSGSVVECLSTDRGVVGSSLTGSTVLCL